jgi:thioredoxin 1
VRAKNQIDGEHLKKLIKKGVTLVDFSTPWCAPCQAQEPVIKALAEKYNGTAKIIDMNVDENQYSAVRRGITSIPTLIIYKDGVEVRRFVGLQPVEVLSGAIEDALR